MFDNWITLLGIFTGLWATTISSVWFLSNWISKEFSKVRDLINSQVKDTKDYFMEKFEYHERHDDARFDEIKKDLWELKLRVASNDVFARNQQIKSEEKNK